MVFTAVPQRERAWGQALRQSLAGARGNHAGSRLLRATVPQCSSSAEGHGTVVWALPSGPWVWCCVCTAPGRRGLGHGRGPESCQNAESEQNQRGLGNKLPPSSWLQSLDRLMPSWTCPSLAGDPGGRWGEHKEQGPSTKQKLKHTSWGVGVMQAV